MSHFLLKTFVVICLASVLTAGGIKASDYFTTKELCPADMVPVMHVPGITCVDRYEAIPDSSCPQAQPATPQATLGNLAIPTCKPVADYSDLEPWRFVAREEARILCARSGKRLPTAAEWYNLALSADTSDCRLVDDEPRKKVSCATTDGVYDLPGGVWEWVSDDIDGKVFSGRDLPESGYVAGVDASGIATQTTTTPQSIFGEDYVWISENSGIMGMVRGGFYGSGADGGIFALQANVPPTFASAGIGFRCVR